MKSSRLVVFNTWFYLLPLLLTIFTLDVSPTLRSKFESFSSSSSSSSLSSSLLDSSEDESLSEEYGERRGKTLFKKYMSAFPAGYRDRVDARHAVQDIRRIEEVFKTKSKPEEPLEVYIKRVAAEKMQKEEDKFRKEVGDTGLPR